MSAPPNQSRRPLSRHAIFTGARQSHGEKSITGEAEITARRWQLPPWTTMQCCICDEGCGSSCDCSDWRPPSVCVCVSSWFKASSLQGRGSRNRPRRKFRQTSYISTSFFISLRFTLGSKRQKHNLQPKEVNMWYQRIHQKGNESWY